MILPIILLAVVLTGCGKKEVTEETEPLPLHEQADLTVWNNKEIKGITPVCSFETSDDELTIYPYYDSDKYIKVKVVEVSDNDFWTSVTKDYINTDNLIVTEDYSYITMPTSITYGFVPISDNSAYFLSSDCPSAYTKKVCELLCSTDT